MLQQDKERFMNLEDSQCMAIVMAGEARGEQDDPSIPNDEGRILIGSIVLNRADYGKVHRGWGLLYGDSVKTVIAAKDQFTSLNSNDRNYPLLLRLINDFDSAMLQYPWFVKIYADAEGLLDGSVPRNCKGIYYETLTSYYLFDEFKKKLGRDPKVEVVIGHHRVYDEL